MKMYLEFTLHESFYFFIKIRLSRKFSIFYDFIVIPLYVHYEPMLKMNEVIFFGYSSTLGAGTKIEFLTDQGETLRNEYLLCKNFKPGFGFFVPRTVFNSHSGPASL